MNWAALEQRVLALIDFPAIVLAVLLVMTLFILWRAQRSGKFDFAEMMRDENGKGSALRFAALGAFAISSWVLMREALEPGPTDPQLFFGYLAAWSGARIFDKFADRWNGVLPWSKA